MSEARLSRGIRLIADDLTGAIDSAAPLAACFGPLKVVWTGAAAGAPPSCAAFDTDTRELARADAAARVKEVARRMWTDFDGLAFKKVDSVWRGSPAAEIAAAVEAVNFDRVVVAPAFPEQGRVTRGGGQWVVDASGERCVIADIAGDLREAGLCARINASPQSRARVSVCDSASESDLRRVVARYLARPHERVLWCGSGGLARALAAQLGPGSYAAPRPGASRPVAGGPVVVFVGTDHPVAQAQADALAERPGVVRWRIDAGARGGSPLPAGAERANVILVRFALPAGTSRPAARARIREALAEAVAALPTPRLIVATGGETLRSLSEAVGATAFEVFSERIPGVPSCAWVDGAWRAVPLISKSGGFGAVSLFCDLLNIELR